MRKPLVHRKLLDMRIFLRKEFPGKAAYPVFPFTAFCSIASNIAQQNAIIRHLS